MDFSVNEIITVTMTLFAVIDILGSIPIIIDLKKKTGHIQSEKATVAVFVIMVSFLFLGQKMLDIIGLDISSFAIAGSIVVFIVAMEMVLGINFFKDHHPEAASIVPLAFPLIAGAGTMTTLLSLKSDFATQNILAGIVINLIIVYIVLKYVTVIERMLGPIGAVVFRKAFGIILLAIAIKLFRTNTGL